MTKTDELNLFLEKVDDFINGKYILADIKIVNILKVIASSDTLLALFRNCLTDFDFNQAKKKYLVKSQYTSNDKGEFILPPNSRELLAFVFNILVDIDGKRINFAEFISRYFYEDGSFSAGYSAFINSMIKPFRNSVKMLMESVIDGKLQDPVEALMEEEQKRAKESEEKQKQLKKEKELSEKSYGESIKAIRAILLKDKTKIKGKNYPEEKKSEILLVIDMLANVVESNDKDAIEYAFVAYKYVAKAYKFTFFNRIKKVQKYLKDIINEL